MRKLKHTEIKATRDMLLAKQGNRCAICNVSFADAKLVKGTLKPKYIATLDHDHSHGHIRGVLCSSCNGSEGKIKNRANTAKRTKTYIEWLESLIAYWKHHATPKTPLIHPTFKSPDERRLARNKSARIKRAQAKARKILKG